MIARGPIVSEEKFQIPELIEKEYDVLWFKKGQIIYSEGSTPLGAFTVRNGKVKVTKIGCQGKEQVIRIVSNYEILDYSHLFLNSKYNGSATAMEDTSVSFIPKQEFLSLLRENHRLFEKLVQLLIMDLHLMEDKAVNFAYKPVRGRLVDALIYLDSKFNDGSNSNLPISIKRSDLAGFIGTVKETVNRLLPELKEEHLITTNGTFINILDIKGLKRISDLYL